MTGSARLKMLKMGERASFSSSARACWYSIGPTGATTRGSATASLVRQMDERLFQVGALDVDVDHVVAGTTHDLAHDGDRLGAEDPHGVAVDFEAARRQRIQHLPRRCAPKAEDDLLAGDAALDDGRRRIRDYGSAVDHDDSLSKLVGFFQVVRREDDRPACRDPLLEVGQERPPALYVEADRGL